MSGSDDTASADEQAPAYCVLVTGSRTWTDADEARRQLERLLEAPAARAAALAHTLWLFHGDARGADTIASSAARALGYRVVAVPCTAAMWREHGRAAGHARNASMLAAADPDVVLALRWDGESRGTDGMVQAAVRSQRANAHLKLVRAVQYTASQPAGAHRYTTVDTVGVDAAATAPAAAADSSTLPPAPSPQTRKRTLADFFSSK